MMKKNLVCLKIIASHDIRHGGGARADAAGGCIFPLAIALSIDAHQTRMVNSGQFNAPQRMGHFLEVEWNATLW
jgi:hypothetical protein